MDDNSSDKKLIEEFKKGKKQALDTIYSKYKNQLLKIIWYYIHDLQDCEDVLQDVFIKIINSIGKYKDKKKVSFYTWMIRIAINTAKDHLKLMKNNYSIDDVSFIKDERVRIADQWERKESLNELRIKVFKLPLKYREVITLIYFEELRYEDVAEILRKPVGTIKSRTNYAINLLKKDIK